MEDRIKNLEEEIAYLRKKIEDFSEILRNMKVENHSHIHYEYKNLFLNEEHIDGDNFPTFNE